MAKKSDKRVRLINAAKELFYKQGFSNTTIAEIAQLADVPLGNVYYYFKTKDEICASVINEYKIIVNSMITEFNLINSTEGKLLAFIDYYVNRAEDIAKYGNVFSNLTQELSKQNNILLAQAQEILSSITSWATEQFKTVYDQSEAEIRAIKFIASIQGLQVLTLAFQDQSILTNQAELLKAEVHDVLSTAKAA